MFPYFAADYCYDSLTSWFLEIIKFCNMTVKDAYITFGRLDDENSRLPT